MPQVGRLLDDAPRTVEYWVRRFEQKGLTGLTVGERPGHPTRLSEAQIQEVSRVLRGKPSDAGRRVNLWDGKALAAWIEKKYAIQLGVRQCQRLFRQFGFRLRKPRPLIAKANPSQQKAHKKTPETDTRSAGRSLGPGRNPFSATRFSLPHVGTAGNQGSHPLPSPAPAQRGILRRRAAERDGKFLNVRQARRFNGQSFWEFLQLLREASAVEDRTNTTMPGCTLRWREQSAPHFALNFLPPYSPELNPIERVWKLTRRLCLHHRYFGFLDTVIDAVESQFRDWAQSNGTLRHLCAITSDALFSFEFDMFFSPSTIHFVLNLICVQSINNTFNRLLTCRLLS